MRILIIEDNQDHVYLMEHILKSDDGTDFQTDIAFCGQDAINKITKTPDAYDSILLDYTLPDANGLDLIDKINALSDKVPIIMVTGRGDEKIAVEAMKRGAYDYVIKSDYFLKSIPHAIKKAVGAHGLKQDKIRLQKEKEKKTRELKIAHNKLKRHSKEIECVNEKLKQLNHIKSNFLSLISHELLTPLTTIQGYVSFIREGNTGKITTQQNDMLKVTEDQVSHLTNMIHELLDLTRFESGKISFKKDRFNIIPVLQSCFDTVKLKMMEKKLNFSTNIATIPEIHIEGDQEKFRRIFINLLNNAIKFTNQKGDITLKNKVKIKVIDTGIGIKREHVKDIFEPFYQIDNKTTRRFSGTGLGLSIVSELTKLHKGTVSLDSQTSKGSCFKLVFPKKSMKK